MPLIKPKKRLPASVLRDAKSQLCGLRHTIFSATGDQYTGEWQNNKKHGRGTQIWKQSGAIYNGEWKFGKRDGFGDYSVRAREANEWKKKYSGEWKNGMKHGFGTFFYDHSARYEGEWMENQRSGWGRMYFDNGDVYEGEWRADKIHGQGIIRLANRNWYEGSWKDGKKNGKGKFYYHDKGQLYDGFWVDGVPKFGALSDFGRDEAPTPARFPIPVVQLVNTQSVLENAESSYQDQL